MSNTEKKFITNYFRVTDENEYLRILNNLNGNVENHTTTINGMTYHWLTGDELLYFDYEKFIRNIFEKTDTVFDTKTNKPIDINAALADKNIKLMNMHGSILYRPEIPYDYADFYEFLTAIQAILPDKCVFTLTEVSSDVDAYAVAANNKEIKELNINNFLVQAAEELMT